MASNHLHIIGAPWWRTLAAPYLHRQYHAVDLMTSPVSWDGHITGPGHLEGGYCLDAPDPVHVHGPHQTFTSVHIRGGVRRPCDYAARPVAL